MGSTSLHLAQCRAATISRTKTRVKWPSPLSSSLWAPRVQGICEVPIRPEEERTGIVVWGHIVRKPGIVLQARGGLPPELGPAPTRATQQVVVQFLEERIIDRDRADPKCRNDLCLRSLVEHAFEERIATTVAKKHQGGCLWHAGDGLGDVGTMPTMHKDLWRDAMLLHDALQVSRSLPVVGGFVGIQDDLSVGS